MKRNVNPILILTALLLLAAISTAHAQSNDAPRFSRGLSTDPSYFPIAVWLQDPSQAMRYKAAGINLYVGLWRGPTERQLAQLKSAGMRLFCSQNKVALTHLDDPTIAGWMQEDEPDNAQEVRDPVTGKRHYGAPVKPSKVVEIYQKMHQLDPTRPVMLNLGQWVANRDWKGRGSEGKPSDYLTYVQGGDILSFDVYPIASYEKPNYQDYLWLVAKGVDQLREWGGPDKTVWNALECTHIGNADRQANPSQVRTEVWMSIIHGSRGIIWFVHQFKPKFDEHALLDDPKMLAAVSAINAQIHQLAPAINSKEPAEVKVDSSNSEVPIDILARKSKGATYVFAVAMRNGASTGTFTLSGKSAHQAEVLGENRRVEIQDGRFIDSFAPFAVHLYKID